MVSLRWLPLRAATLGHALKLAGIGVSLALEQGDPGECFRWVELSRRMAASLRPDVTPSPELARLINRLREVHSQASTTIDDVTLIDLRRQAVELETQVRRLAWREQALEPVATADVIDVETLRSRLHGRAILIYVDAGISLAVLVVRPDQELRLIQLGPLQPVRRMVAKLHARLTDATGRQDEAASAACARSAAALDELLGRPGLLVEDRPAVVVPSATISAVPWPLLPSMLGLRPGWPGL